MGSCSPKADERPLHPEAVSKLFENRVGRGDLPKIRLHDLRHSHCAHLVAAGLNVKLISTRLGHASVAFTLDRYGHLLPAAGAGAATAIAALVDGFSESSA
jgi:integrase